MATGIVSIAAADHGLKVISEVLIVIAAVTLPVLMVMVARAWREFDMRDPNVTLALFTYIAACAVVGARLADHRIVLWVLAGMALQGWLSLMPLAVRSMWRHRWTGLRDRARGGWELAAVATSGLAIVSAELDVLFWAVVVLGARHLRVSGDDRLGALARAARCVVAGTGAARRLDSDGRHSDCDAGR